MKFMTKIACAVLFVGVLLSGCASRDPLIGAAFRGDSETAKQLLGNGHDVNMLDAQGQTPLIWASKNNRTEMVSLLLANHANPDVQDEHRDTALMLAVEAGNIEVVKLLLPVSDTNLVNGDGDTALHMAVASGNIEIARMLLAQRANVGIKNEKGKTPLDLAKAQKRFVIARLLSERSGKTAISEEAGKELLSVDDLNQIPSFKAKSRNNDVAIVIGIEDYREGLPKSEFSNSDATLVKSYFRAMGIPERNIQLLTNNRASLSDLKKVIENWLPDRVKSDSHVFVYYSGHGAPDPTKGDAYIVPYDGDPNYLEATAYPLNRLYDTLGKLPATTQTLVLLDSCFSGAGGRSVIAEGARPLVVMRSMNALPSNVTVLAATQNAQISTSSKEKGAGVFTYYFLKALKDGKKDLADVYTTIKPEVEDEARSMHVAQSPWLSVDAKQLAGHFDLW